jgi:hypothetical protein
MGIENAELLKDVTGSPPAQVLYKVRFRRSDIWGCYDGPAVDQLEGDIYEHGWSRWTEQVALSCQTWKPLLCPEAGQRQ